MSFQIQMTFVHLWNTIEDLLMKSEFSVPLTVCNYKFQAPER